MARRGANGEGTIYRRKDGNGRFEAAVYVRTSTGKSKRIRVYGKTREEAYARRLEIQASANQGILMPERSYRLADYLDYWLENIVRPNLRPKTIQQYESVSRLYLKPGLGAVKLTDLTVPMVQAFFNEQLTLTIAKGQSITKVHGMRAVLRTALMDAQRNELVSRNVAKLVKLQPSRRKRIRPWTADEAIAFLDAARQAPLFPAFALLLLYGFRRGELLGLRWQDIDFEHGIICVRQQLQKVGKALVIGPVKTEAGERELPLLRVARRLLASHPGSHNSVKSTTTSDELVFTRPDGRPIDPDIFYRSFKRLCSAVGVRPITLHHARHTTTTLLKRLGVQDRDSQLILGHSHVTVTQEIYQHADLDDHRIALGKLEATLFSSSEDEESDHCRQISRQSSLSQTWQALAHLLNRSYFGAGGGIRTPEGESRLIYSSTGTSLQVRITSVDLCMQGRTRRWKLGCVAVNLAVKSHHTFELTNCNNDPSSTGHFRVA